MEIIIPCLHCADAVLAKKGGFGPEGLVLSTRAMHVQDHSLYRATCPEGHKLVAVLDHQPFELLFESGLEALVDGYFRESISSFAAALERLYEFSIRVQLISDNVAIDELETMWKLVGTQSERQLGMYVGLRTSKEGKPPPMLSPHLIKFRNSVIHKGYFPDGNEAFKFGDAVFKLIMAEVLRLDERHRDAVGYEINARRKKACNALEKGENPQFLNFGLAVADRADRLFSGVVIKAQESMLRRRAGEAPPIPNNALADEAPPSSATGG